MNHVEAPSGFALLGNQRAGKSGALGLLTFDGVMRGTETVLIDFSGPLARLADHPALAGRVRVLDLMSAQQGTLDPMGDAIIPGDPRTDVAVRVARGRLAHETLAVLGWQVIRSDGTAEAALVDAISQEIRSDQPSTVGVIDRLRHSPEPAGKNFAKIVGFQLQAEEAGLIAGTSPAPVLTTTDAICTIVICPGLALPGPGKPLAELAPDERLGSALFGCALHLGRRLLWDLPFDLLKLLLVDEAHVALANPAGRRLIEAALRDGPKRGVATGLATHNAVDLGDERYVNALSTVFQFRSTAEDELTACMRINRLEDTPANRQRIRGLANGECIATFPAVNGVTPHDRFQWDRWPAGLADTLNTTVVPRRLESVA